MPFKTEEKVHEYVLLSMFQLIFSTSESEISNHI